MFDAKFWNAVDVFCTDIPADDYFDDADVYKYYSEDTQTLDDDDDTSDDGDLTPFARLATKMTDITKVQDSGVLKETLHQGTGNVVPPDAYVTGEFTSKLAHRIPWDPICYVFGCVIESKTN